VLDGIAHQQGKEEDSHLVSTAVHLHTIGENKMSSGVALLKMIIIREERSHLDSKNATTNQIQTKLSSLDTYITTINSDIGCFNQNVKLLVQLLTARNQTTSDLLMKNLAFQGLWCCQQQSLQGLVAKEA
jgi:hypothetical protein